MVELLSSYSIATILIILVLALFGIKEIIEAIDFFKNKISKKYNANQEMKDDKNVVLEKLNKLEGSIEAVDSKQKELIGKMNEQENILTLLKDSDKDQIKYTIVKEYHKAIQKGWIDDFSMDSIEKNYEHYQKEGGNSYVHDLMDDLRCLPHSPKEIS